MTTRWLRHIGPDEHHAEAWTLQSSDRMYRYAVVEYAPDRCVVCYRWWDTPIATFSTLDEARTYAEIAEKFGITERTEDGSGAEDTQRAPG